MITEKQTERKTKVFAICLGQIPSAIVGVVEPLNELKKKNIIEFTFLETLKVTKREIAEADVVIFIRSSETYEYTIAKECKRLGKYIIYYLDDDLLNIPETANSYIYFSNETIQKNIIDIMKLSNCLWTNNINIEKKYKDFFSKSAVTHAPALLLKHLEWAEEIEESDTVKIGFAGGIDHQGFLESFLEEPIQYLIHKYGSSITFEFMGAKPSFVERLSLVYIPYQDTHEKYIKMIQERRWDIGLAPLPESPFHACKYFNKYLEYGAIGCAGVYSDVQPYKQIVVNEYNGLLVDNDKNAWMKAISNLIENGELRKRIRREARKKLEDEFTTINVAESAQRKIDELSRYKAPVCREGQVKLQSGKIQFFMERFNTIIKNHGINSPVYITKKIIIKLCRRLPWMDSRKG